MDRLESMQVAVEIAEAGSLSAAGRRLRMPLASVSRKLSELEAHLGTRLFARTSRRLAPTDAGAAYVAACRRILEQLGEAERAASGEYSAPKGDLTIAAPIVFGRLHVLPIAIDFLRAYPDIDIRIELADRVVDILEDHIDVAIRIGALRDSSFVASRVGAIRRVVCASPAYLAARGTPAVPGDLAAHDCISFAGLGPPGHWTFPAGGAEVSVAIRSRLSVSTAEAAVDAAVAGVGITRLLSYQVAAAVKAGALVVALQDFEPAPAPVSVVHTGQTPLARKLRAFLDFATPRLRAALTPGVVA